LSESASFTQPLDVGGECGGGLIGSGGHVGEVRRASRIATCQIVIGYLDRFIPIELPGGSKLASDPKARREEKMRSNPTRSALLNFFERRPDAAPTTTVEVASLFRRDASCRAVGYHLRVLAANGLLESDDTQGAPRFQLA
jgi:hypothetical protein